MRTSLSLELSLYRRQKAAIAEALGKRPRTHAAYERRYRAHLPRSGEPISLEEVDRRVRVADVVFVGDYASFAPAQRAFADLVERSLHPSHPSVIALQGVDAAMQPELARFVAGRLSRERLRLRLGAAGPEGETFWSHLLPILALARDRGLELLPLDSGGRSLEAWDRGAAERIARRLGEADRPRVFVLAGQFHVAPCHLPAEVLGRVRARPLTLFQNSDPHYWNHARRLDGRTASALSLSDAAVCLFSGTPVLCQQSFLELIEGDEEDGHLTGALAEEVRGIAEAIGGHLGVRVARPWSALTVASAEDLDLLVDAVARGGFSRAEQQRIHHHVLSRESGYFPRARLLYLANRSVSHASEEVSHWLRHVLVGEALMRPRRGAQAFHARVLEEALAFFATRWIVPSRPFRSAEEWLLMLEGRGPARQEAAFVLAHLSAARNGGTLEALIPTGNAELFHAVTHGLGYLLGDALWRAHRRRRISDEGVGALFRDPFDDASATYRALCSDLLR